MSSGPRRELLGSQLSGSSLGACRSARLPELLPGQIFHARLCLSRPIRVSGETGRTLVCLGHTGQSGDWPWAAFRTGRNTGALPCCSFVCLIHSLHVLLPAAGLEHFLALRCGQVTSAQR